MAEGKWASIEDFATLFQYFWYRDFPMDQVSTGARRSDWTIHIGIVVRNIADLIGYMARFESGKRKDAVLRNTEQDVIALEWEWEERLGNELEKLKKHRLWTYDNNEQRKLQYAVLISYAEDVIRFYEDVLSEWGKGEKSSWPLLLILIEKEESDTYFSGREFKNLRMAIFEKGKYEELRSAPAISWKVPKTRWSREFKK
jgi:hypothetical protein